MICAQLISDIEIVIEGSTTQIATTNIQESTAQESTTVTEGKDKQWFFYLICLVVIYVI